MYGCSDVSSCHSALGVVRQDNENSNPEKTDKEPIWKQVLLGNGKKAQPSTYSNFIKEANNAYTNWFSGNPTSSSLFGFPTPNTASSSTPKPIQSGPAMRLPSDCVQPFNEMCQRLHMKSEDLLKVFMKECSGDPNKISPDGKACGLIQFRESTLNALGKRLGRTITLDNIKQMSIKDQLPLIEEYFNMAKDIAPNFDKNKELTGQDVYELVFCPARAGQEVLYAKNNPKQAQAYNLNRGCDLNGDGIITASEMGARIA